MKLFFSSLFFEARNSDIQLILQKYASKNFNVFFGQKYDRNSTSPNFLRY